MKKRILSAAALIWISIIWMLFYLAGKPPAVSLPEYDEVREVQLDAFRMDAARFDGEALCVLLENMRSVRPVSRLRAWQTDRPDGRFVIAFTDEQGTRTAWSFFRDGETCYMEAEDGSLYEGADFMREYVAEEPGWHPSPRGVSAGMYVPDDGEAACASETGCDVRFWLYSETLRQMANGLAGEEAVLAAKETVLREYRLFRYATEQGYGIPETEYDQVVAERIADAAKQESAAEISLIYENAGITLDEYIGQMSGLIWRARDTVDYMLFCFRQEFREGSDMVDGVVYRSAGEYSAARMNQVVIGRLQDVAVPEFEEELAEAEKYCRGRL